MLSIRGSYWITSDRCPFSTFNVRRLNTLRLGQAGCQFPDDIFKYIFLNENIWISIEISLKFVLKGPVNNIPSLVQIMAWRRPGDKPLSEPMMVRLPTHICVSRPQWVNIPWSLLTARLIPWLSYRFDIYQGFHWLIIITTNRTYLKCKI